MDKCIIVHNPIVPGCKLMRDKNGVSIESGCYKQIVVFNEIFTCWLAFYFSYCKFFMLT